MKRFVKMLLAVLVMTIGVVAINPLAANAASKETTRKDGTLKGTTIWLTRNEVAYSSSGKKVATIKKGKKVTAIKQSKSGKILVKYGKKKLYIDSTYVLVNIKEYIPSLDIRLDMSKSENDFNMAGEKIPGVSDKRFYTSKESKAGTAAWLRFQVAQKLLKAQKAFKKDGYGIVIYDAYRPYTITCKIRDGFKKFLKNKPYSFKKKWFGQLGESWFLAQNASSHNYGRAVDMSLKVLETGRMLKMPSKMHTLDKRAAYYYWAGGTGKASKNASYMKKMMEAAGFTYLKSEWWHFQVNSIPYGNVIDLKI